MAFNQIIIWVMAAGILMGAGDRILGNRFGLGQQFEEGFNALGPLALGMVGIVSLTPVIAKVLGPAIIPVFNLFGADPAMFAAILANDMGGYPLALKLAQSEQMGLLSGLIVASMLGCTLVFSIPVGLGLIEYKDRPFFAKGLLAGLICIPFGGIVGGVIAGFNLQAVITNMVPVMIFSGLLSVGLAFIPAAMIKGALMFGKMIVVLITVGLGASAFEALTGVALIPGMAPVMDGLKIVAQIAVVLLGTFPILSLFIRFFGKGLNGLGTKIGMNGTGAAGLVITLANSIPVYKMMKDMDERGKVINTAWLVPATAALGDHLGFTAAVNPRMIAAVLVGKLAAGVLAIVVALWVSRDLSWEIQQSRKMEQEIIHKGE